MKQKLLVTSALPYANGSIHLGHVAGAYLPADIYVRFNRLVGNDVLYISGTDEHGIPIALKAEQENVTPRTIVKRYHEQIKEAFDKLKIQFDNFSGTSNVHNKHHAVLAREFFMQLLKNDYIASRLSDQFYCGQCNRFLADRFIEGICPNCASPARGDECPNCSHQFEAMELKSPRCKICGHTPEVKATKHWYLRLDKIQKKLEDWINTKTQWKENVVNFVKGWFKQGLKERAITRDIYWGVPVPLNNAPGKVLYVWFDAPIGYISSTMQWADRQGVPEKWREYWQDPERKIIHFIGKDNIPFHAIVWPATLMGQKEEYQLPHYIAANEHLKFGSSKASKSKGNVVWVEECMNIFPCDPVRYYLAACAPEKSDTIFSWKDFQGKNNSELLGVFGNFANRVLKFIHANFEGKIPESSSLSDRDNQILESIKESAEKIQKSFENFEVRNAISEIISLTRLGNQYFDEKAPWKTLEDNKQDCQNCLFVSTQLVNALSVFISPVIPDSAEKLWQQIGHEEKLTNWEQAQKQIPAGHKIATPKALFQKIEDKLVEKLDKKLQKTLDEKEGEGEESSETPLKEKQIPFASFAELDLRIAEIIEAQPVPKAKKLLKLAIQVGRHKRQIIAGIAEHYKPEELVGKKVPVVVNLEPAKIRGEESQGMMLCADIEGKPILLQTIEDVPSGTIIR